MPCDTLNTACCSKNKQKQKNGMIVVENKLLIHKGLKHLSYKRKMKNQMFYFDGLNIFCPFPATKPTIIKNVCCVQSGFMCWHAQLCYFELIKFLRFVALLTMQFKLMYKKIFLTK